ncbi:concanavalin A-like lectin/glucanase domain-containing protein [Cladochytrium replicatum]|nr:concanavalin A-like lectin/glucanase domain-containing protein [Cladochytrium replicatum]
MSRIGKLLLIAVICTNFVSALPQVNCGSGLSVCGSACYNPSQFVCYTPQNVLCEVGQKICGTSACYKPTQYHCVNGALADGPETSTTTAATATRTTTTTTTTAASASRTTTGAATATATSTASTGSKPACDPGKTNFCLAFQDDFDFLDTSKWRHDITLGGGGNWEFQMYSNSRNNTYVRDGVLYIRPTLTSANIGEASVLSGYTYDVWGNHPANQCTGNAFFGCSRTSDGTNIINPIQSALIRSVNTVSLRYGRVEFRARLPKGDWIWPALWLLPKNDFYGNWPASGEIDVVESRGNDPSYSAGGRNAFGSTLHWGPTWDQNKYPLTTAQYKLPSGDFSTDFHTFGLEWTPSAIKTYIDSPSNVVLNVPLNNNGGFWSKGGFTYGSNPWANQCTQAPFDQEFYLIMNVAVGGTNTYFPDGVGGKPWSTTSSTAARDFWNARSSWLPTWNVSLAFFTEVS